MIDGITALRTLRAEFTPGGDENAAARAAMLARRFTVTILPETDVAAQTLRDQLPALIALARLGDVQISQAPPESGAGQLGLSSSPPAFPARHFIFLPPNCWKALTRSERRPG